MIPTLARPLLEQELQDWSPAAHPSLLVELYVDWMSGIAAFEEEIDAQEVPTSEEDDSAATGAGGGEGGGVAATSTAYQCLGLVIEQVP